MLKIPFTLLVVIILLVLPLRLSSRQFIRLAFALWMSGGLVLIFLGVTRFAESSSEHSGASILAAILLSTVLGYAKGRFILAKTSRRNIERIFAMTEPKKPIFVYSIRSWLIISATFLLSQLLNYLAVPPYWRGTINLAVGMALVISSLNYCKAFQHFPENFRFIKLDSSTLNRGR